MFEDRRKRICMFCKDQDSTISYLSPKFLRRYISDRGKIIPRRYTGVCAKHQRKVSRAIKIAREMSLLPYVGRAPR
ncbi:30S ribosomal protein S18 [candidate division TA06 bacterium]|nr:30S ribosomal protein S18 [candidate division TA06 bacterium]